jgi:hypothetical protein
MEVPTLPPPIRPEETTKPPPDKRQKTSKGEVLRVGEEPPPAKGNVAKERRQKLENELKSKSPVRASKVLVRLHPDCKTRYRGVSEEEMIGRALSDAKKARAALPKVEGYSLCFPFVMEVGCRGAYVPSARHVKTPSLCYCCLQSDISSKQPAKGSRVHLSLYDRETLKPLSEFLASIESRKTLIASDELKAIVS